PNDYPTQTVRPHVGRHRLDEGARRVAARLHDGVRRSCGRLHARGRTGPRRGDQDRHRRPQGRRRAGEGPGRRHAGLFRAAGECDQPARVVLVAMEIFGLHEWVKDITRRVAKLGALAIAPDYYFRFGQDLTKITEIKELFPIVNAKPDAELFADLDATVAWAKSEGGDTGRLGI